MSTRTTDDERHMQRALQLARRGQGHVEPNPMVGCVIVRGRRVVGEGYHRRFGGPHAEVAALRGGASARGATVYVTLEPCCHFGKTPPCVDALIAAGVKRVVAAMEDPNPEVSGKGVRRLRRAGMRVEVGLLGDVAADLNAPFIKLQTQRRPWVILKWAQSIDGKIATHTGDSKWISDEVARSHAHRVRGRVDALLVGVQTVLMDDPLLTCRVGRPRRVATRVVLDPQLRTPPGAQLVRTAETVPTWIVTSTDAAVRRERHLVENGCVVHRIRKTRAGLSLPAVLDLLGAAQMSNVVVEGGGRVLGAFADADLADEFHIYVAPRLIGGAAASGPLQGVGVDKVAAAGRFGPDVRWRRMGDGWLLTARAERSALTSADR